MLPRICLLLLFPILFRSATAWADQATWSGAPTSEELRLVDAWLDGFEDPAGESDAEIRVNAHPFGDLGRRGSTIGTPLRVGEKTFERGLGTHAGAEFLVTLPQPAQRFTARLGIDRNPKTRDGAGGSAELVVLVEGREAARSGVIRGDGEPVSFEIDLSGVRAFTLRIEDGGDGVASDHLDLLEARVVLADGSSRWLDEFTIVRKTAPFPSELPFRFLLDGEDSRDFLGDWKHDVEDMAPAVRGGKTRRHAWTDPRTGLRVTWELTRFSEYPAVDWVLRFENTGEEASPRIHGLRALDLLAGPVAGNEPRLLHAARGGAPTGIAYQPLQADLAGGVPVHLEPIDGRSSNGYLPFVNLQLGEQGIAAGIGWSGQWSLHAAAEGPRVRLQAGQSQLDLRLDPGERIRSPRILLVHWQGERMHGQNLFRRVLRDHYRPLLDGEAPEPFVQCNAWFPLGSGERATEERLVSYLDGYRDSGLEHLVMDAGWYGPEAKAWNLRTGSWTPNPEQFPNGLAPIGAAAKENGLGFGLWFEPERVMPDTWLHREHPEWILRRPPTRYRPFNPMTDAGLLHLGKPPVQDWVTELIGDYSRKIPLAYFRHDFNHFDSIGFLRAADPPGKTGINEIRYAEGLYRILDRLRADFPGLVMEGCASGGRRIDLETLRRNHLYWKADHIYGEPHHQQTTLFAGLHWLPGGFLNSTVLDLVENRYALHSTYGGSLTVGWDPTQSEPKPEAHYFRQGYDSALAAAQIASFREVRHLFSGDFFPLTPYSPSEKTWIGWQFHRDDLDEGVALLFRRAEAAGVKHTVKLRGLDPAATYRLRIEGEGQIAMTEADGAALAAGIEATLAEPETSVLIHYRSIQ